MGLQPLLTVDEICQVLQCTNEFIYKAIKRGMPCLQIGNRHRFEREEVITWLKAQDEGNRSKRSKPRTHPPISEPEALPLCTTPAPEKTPLEILPLPKPVKTPVTSTLSKQETPKPETVKSTKLAASYGRKIAAMAVKAVGNPQKIARARQELMTTCSEYETNNGQCCTDERTVINCVLKAFESDLKRCENALKTARTI